MRRCPIASSRCSASWSPELVTDIAGQLKLSVKTVSTHKANLMQKLGLHNQSELVRYAIRHGLAGEDLRELARGVIPAPEPESLAVRSRPTIADQVRNDNVRVPRTIPSALGIHPAANRTLPSAYSAGADASCRVSK